MVDLLRRAVAGEVTADDLRNAELTVDLRGWDRQAVDDLRADLAEVVEKNSR